MSEYYNGLTKDEVIAGYTMDRKLPNVGDCVHHTEEMDVCGRVTKVRERSVWYDHGDDDDGLQRVKFDDNAVRLHVRTYDVKWSDGLVGSYMLGAELQVKP